MTRACSHLVASLPSRSRTLVGAAVDSGGSMTRMHAVELVLGLGWAAFWIYWFAAAVSTKRGRVPVARELGIRAVLALCVIVLIRLRVFRGAHVHTSPVRAAFGLLLFAVGLGFAIWARVHIGRNWGTPMSQKVEPELVTSGPYRLVRHPIYSGILVAGAGTAAALSWTWLAAVALAVAYFVYAATVEERFLTEEFPEEYAAYKRSTKMLVPLIL
jgi:protein-S-isoprenylcysteine O-methyltransferase Ste14